MKNQPGKSHLCVIRMSVVSDVNSSNPIRQQSKQKGSKIKKKEKSFLQNVVIYKLMIE